MIHLDDLHEGTIIQNLRVRFDQDIIYVSNNIFFFNKIIWIHLNLTITLKKKDIYWRYFSSCELL